ncbi:uncharacterized protein PGTG_17199 [Puccinia graminis f. sp. tritici CRL 75-36-700-3]|uniref:Uncharacterized protein n=1 Tax=Puccinia graminis f. sp. tritici (strain CRL 75-36-700-3 / race SCCL) TaxID=418459 RepID=E3L302_PUCGT|nr:uncharacterized protein PGTG_17199 [Puccinia graminis f. sp. tritici CRL 75-36-700-3]EFP90927.1 hypothetical protein PGTG_17199 [Puccinia graminis f. sp. tritici CRL 75-36-700-3]
MEIRSVLFPSAPDTVDMGVDALFCFERERGMRWDVWPPTSFRSLIFFLRGAVLGGWIIRGDRFVDNGG